jgi:prevent-host-death family protein
MWRQPVRSRRSERRPDGDFGLPASAAACSPRRLHSTDSMTMILVMTTQSLAAVKARFSQVIEEVTGTHERVVVTRNGSPVAIIMAVDDYESLMETLAVLSDQSAVSEIREAERQMAEGEAFGEEDVRAALTKRRT